MVLVAALSGRMLGWRKDRSIEKRSHDQGPPHKQGDQMLL
jgi:hypothetical protein